MQVISLQAQLASIKEQAANKNFINGSDSANCNQKYNGRLSHQQEYPQTWYQQENSNMMPQFPNFMPNDANSMMDYLENKSMDANLVGNCKSPIVPEENVLYARFDEASDHYSSSLDTQTINRQWGFQDSNDLHESVPFSYTHDYYS